MKRCLASLMVIVLVGLIVKDSFFHFDRDLVLRKIENSSDQRNWSFFYGQEHVYISAGLKYKADFDAIRSMIKPKSLVLADLATSYHIAASLPVYVLNVHRHQQSSGRWEWRNFLKNRYFCYQEFDENRKRVLSIMRSRPILDYLVVNNDKATIHRKKDCLAFRGHVYPKELSNIAVREYQGEYLDLYSFKTIFQRVETQ